MQVKTFRCIRKSLRPPIAAPTFLALQESADKRASFHTRHINCVPKLETNAPQLFATENNYAESMAVWQESNSSWNFQAGNRVAVKVSRAGSGEAGQTSGSTFFAGVLGFSH